MANLKDLAGLAALGAIGYKLSQGKDNTTAAAYRTGVMGGARTPVASDSMMDQGAGTNVPRPGQSTISGLQVNPDANLGEPSNPDYSNEGRTPSRTLSPKAASTANPKARGMTGAQNDTLARANKSTQTTTTPSPVKTKPQLAKPGTGVGADIEALANPKTQEDRMRRYQKDAQMGKKIDLMRRQINMYNANPEMEDQVKQNMSSAGMFKRGGSVKKMAKGGMTSSASKRADGIASKGKTKCKMY